MTVFRQALKKGALAVRHIEAGLWLDEDDHGLTLKHTDKDGNTSEIAHWGIYAEIFSIRREADKWLVEHGTATNTQQP